MSAASIETTLEVWAMELRETKRRIRPLFTQERVATPAGLFPVGCSGQSGAKPGLD